MSSSTKLFTDDAYKDHTVFWKTALDPADNDFHFRQPWLSYAPDHAGVVLEELQIPKHTRALISDIGRGQDIGILVVVVSAIAYLLHKYTGAPVIQIDSPPLKQRLEAAYADSAVPLILLPASEGNRSIRDYLNQTRDIVAGSYSFQNFPIRQVAGVLLRKPEPKTNVAVVFPAIHDSTPAVDEYDLCVIISRDPDLRVQFRGNARAFSCAYLQAFARHCGNVLQSYGSLSLPLAKVGLMTDAERERILVEYNKTQKDFPLDKTIPMLFCDQAQRSPQSAAIRCYERSLSYDALNRESNRMARVLQAEYGVRPGDVVGVVTHRSELLIAGLLGVLKAGGVYLPMDPDYPEERLQFMVLDAGVKLLLVHSDHLTRLAALYETPMFALDLQLPAVDCADVNLDASCAANDPAYIIYTSGSTGQPKAVVLEHRGFVNMVLHHIDAFGIDASDRLLQFYGHSFDSSLFEIFAALISGAALVMVGRDTINDPEQLSRYIEEQKVTTLTLPPIYLSTLHRDKLGSVRRFISAGDNCRVDDAAYFARTKDYYNSYGPTETSVCVTHYKVDPDKAYGSRIPIGKSISNTSIYLLDEKLDPVPEGVAGEICVGGVSLARGYLNREDLTAEKFVPNPFGSGRLYRTGDLGVWLPDGNLELIGRKDNQVKIRGYRIELGEIEAGLAQHPRVKETVVLAREDQPDNKRLVAYVTGDPSLEEAELRPFLKARLPEFMVPSAFVVLQKMPLTANGKIDRKALPVPGGAEPGKDPSLDAPRNAKEEILVRVWKEVLGIDRVGIHDNLFELGGDSILVIQIVSRARNAGLKLTPPQMFEYQTIAQLSSLAALAPHLEGPQESVEGMAPLTPIQEWFFEQDIVDRRHFNQSVMLEVPSEFNAALGEAATRKLVEHHDALRLRFFEQGSRWFAEYRPLSDSTAFSVLDVSHLSGPDQDAAVVASASELQTSLDLHSGPLIRVRLFLLGPAKPARILFIVHHLVVDGVSWRVLLEDFHAAYSQSSLPAKTASFKAWSGLLKEYASAHISDERSYWLSENRRRVPPIPVDHAGGASMNTIESSREVTISLDEAATAALLHEAPRAYNTEINDLLLAALSMTFVGWTGHDRLLIDLEGHGREDLFEDVDISRTVGWLTAQFPVVIELQKDAGFGEALKSVKEQLRAAPRRGVGYGLMRYLSGDIGLVDELKSLPKAEVLFNYLGQTGRALSPGTLWTPIIGMNGPEHSAHGKRTHLLEIHGIAIDGRLSLTWNFSENVHLRATVEALARRYEETLRGLIDHCKTAPAKEYTPSDFPAARLDQKSLDALIARINR